MPNRPEARTLAPKRFGGIPFCRIDERKAKRRRTEGVVNRAIWRQKRSHITGLEAPSMRLINANAYAVRDFYKGIPQAAASCELSSVKTQP
jgi:hypothetical protein